MINIQNNVIIENNGESKSLTIRNYEQRDANGNVIYVDGSMTYQMTMQSFNQLCAKMTSGQVFYIKTLDNTVLAELPNGVSYTGPMGSGGQYYGMDATGGGTTEFSIYGASIDMLTIPRANDDLLPGEYPQSPVDRRKLYRTSLKFVFSDGSEYTLPHSGSQSEPTLKLLAREAYAPVLSIPKSLVDLVAPIQPGDVLDIDFRFFSQTGYGGVTTQVAAKPETTFANSSSYAINTSVINFQPWQIEVYSDLSTPNGNPIAVNLYNYIKDIPPTTLINYTWSHNNNQFSFTGTINNFWQSGDSVNPGVGISINPTSDTTSWQNYINNTLGSQPMGNNLTLSVTLSIPEQTLNAGFVTISLPGLVAETAPVVPYTDPSSIQSWQNYYIELAPQTTNYSNAVADYQNIWNGAAATTPFSASIAKNGQSAGGGSGEGGGSGGESGGGGSGEGGGGSSTTPVSGAVVVGGKAVGTVAVDPRTTAVRVTIGGVEQALPAGSVVRNTVTGQKFLKVAGGELEFAAISVTPPVEWAWSAAGAQGWSVLQGF